MLPLQSPHFQRGRKRSPPGDEELSMRIVLDNPPPVDVIFRPRCHEIETDDAFAAALSALPPRLLQRHVKPRERVEVLLRPRFALRRRERRLGVEVLRAHELLLTQLAAFL